MFYERNKETQIEILANYNLTILINVAILKFLMKYKLKNEQFNLKFH